MKRKDYEEKDSLNACQTIQDYMAINGFDFNDIKEVWTKLFEEIEELKEAIETKDKQNIEHEIGDILIGIVELCRFLNIDAEKALRKANDRMFKRFSYVKKTLEERGKDFKTSSQEEIDKIWNESKKFDYL